MAAGEEERVLLLRVCMCSRGSCQDRQSSGLLGFLALCPQPLSSPKGRLC